MKLWFEKLKLNQKITSTIMLIVIIPILLFSVGFYSNYKNNTVREVRTKTTNQVSEDYNQLKKIVEFSNMSAQSFLNNQELKGFLRRLKDHEDISVDEYLRFYRNNIAMLERQVNSNPYLYQIRVYADNNSFPEMMPILYHGDRMKELSWSGNYHSREWQFDYPDMIEGDSSGIRSDHLMALVSNITDDYGEVLGVVEVAVEMDEVFPGLYSSDIKNWGCFQSDEGGIYTFDSKENPWQKYQKEILNAAPKRKKGIHAFQTEIDGRKVILLSQPIKELQGTYIQLTSIETAMNDITLQRNLLITILFLIFFMLAMVVNLVIKGLLSKFYSTLSVVRKVQDGNMDVRVCDLGQDEMGELGVQINKMLDRIQTLMKENVDREVLIKNTEIKALQNQINTHFIYNVLESVKMMAEIDEEYEISDAVTALGGLLRYSMKWVSSDVTIMQELDYIKNYIQLMNLRYDFTIILSINVPDIIYEQQVPKMSLQPIVENAIIHGIEEIQEDSTVYIKAFLKGDDYEIEITDSGKGMTKDQVELLRKKISGEVQVHGGSGNGIGLKNVQDRIHMRFGKEYGLKLASKEGLFTKVTLLLPLTNVHSDGSLKSTQ
ncbi:histidine kinase [Blautia liquoris]|uniref:histidine kinase n=1 Tax=Blautia liquoris TaxID=2779518 RepID=A0A7M2RDU4_9FIRM|nr:histidine kinase [Blautia liquoris]QOV18328.1 histidine kinase [Blautia liquoris]